MVGEFRARKCKENTVKIARFEKHVPKNWERCVVRDVRCNGEVAIAFPKDLLTGNEDETRPVYVDYARKGVVFADESGLFLKKDQGPMMVRLMPGQILVVARDDRDEDGVDAWGWAFIGEYRWALDQWDGKFNPHRVHARPGPVQVRAEEVLDAELVRRPGESNYAFRRRIRRASRELAVAS